MNVEGNGSDGFAYLVEYHSYFSVEIDEEQLKASLEANGVPKKEMPALIKLGKETIEYMNRKGYWYDRETAQDSMARVITEGRVSDSVPDLSVIPSNPETG